MTIMQESNNHMRSNNAAYKARSNGNMLDVESFLPPQSKDLEDSILGALMLEREAIYQVIDTLDTEDFYIIANQLVYQAILNAHAHSHVCDISIVIEELLRMKRLDDVGGPLYVTKLTNSVVSSANIQAHIRIVLQKSMQRKIIKLGSDIRRQAYLGDTDVFDLMQIIQKDLDAINPESRLQKNITAPVVVKETLLMVEKAMNAGGMAGVPTGNAKMDEYTGGFMESDLIVIAARPGHGKTAMACAQMHHQTGFINPAYDIREPASYSLYPAFCASIEMSRQLLMLRMIAAELFDKRKGIPYSKMRRGEITIEEKNLIDLTGAELAKRNIYIDDTSNVTTTTLRARILRLVRECGIKIVYVDYVQIIQRLAGPNAHYQNDASFLKAVMVDLKGIAKEAKIPFIVLAQILRDADKRESSSGFRFRMSDLKGSGGIEEGADGVVILHRPEQSDPEPIDYVTGASLKNIIQAEFVKNRNDRTGMLNIPFHIAYNSFGEIDNIPDTVTNYLNGHPASKGPIF